MYFRTTVLLRLIVILGLRHLAGRRRLRRLRGLRPYRRGFAARLYQHRRPAAGSQRLHHHQPRRRRALRRAHLRPGQGPPAVHRRRGSRDGGRRGTDDAAFALSAERRGPRTRAADPRLGGDALVVSRAPAHDRWVARQRHSHRAMPDPGRRMRQRAQPRDACAVRHGDGGRAGGAERRGRARPRRRASGAGLARLAAAGRVRRLRPRGLPRRARARRRRPCCDARPAARRGQRRAPARHGARPPLALGDPRRALRSCAPVHPRLAALRRRRGRLAAAAGHRVQRPVFSGPIALARASDRVLGRRRQARSDLARTPGWLDGLLGPVLGAEARLIGSGRSLPFGVSLVALLAAR